MGIYWISFYSSFKKKKINSVRERKKHLIIPPNIVVRASKSGKSNDENHDAFLNEVLHPFVGKNFFSFLMLGKLKLI
jgi:hypothetical protein